MLLLQSLRTHLALHAIIVTTLRGSQIILDMLFFLLSGVHSNILIILLTRNLICFLYHLMHFHLKLLFLQTPFFITMMLYLKDCVLEKCLYLILGHFVWLVFIHWMNLSSLFLSQHCIELFLLLLYQLFIISVFLDCLLLLHQVVEVISLLTSWATFSFILYLWCKRLKLLANVNACGSKTLTSFVRACRILCNYFLDVLELTVVLLLFLLVDLCL